MEYTIDDLNAYFRKQQIKGINNHGVFARIGTDDATNESNITYFCDKEDGTIFAQVNNENYLNFNNDDIDASFFIAIKPYLLADSYERTKKPNYISVNHIEFRSRDLDNLAQLVARRVKRYL